MRLNGGSHPGGPQFTFLAAAWRVWQQGRQNYQTAGCDNVARMRAEDTEKRADGFQKYSGFGGKRNCCWAGRVLRGSDKVPASFKTE